MIEKILALSTRHVDQSARPFVRGGIKVGGNFRTTEHEFGWIVFLMDNPERPLEHWFQPIYSLAIKEKATMVLFDRDIPPNPDFPTFDW